ncbi:MAG TPA: tetratricopeptide repeat protein [Acidisarcina sp.]|nr:tetratricopeptide repeat protein [Acidisarcina sp.]
MRRILTTATLVLAATALFLYAYPAASLVYEAVVVLHIVLGVALLVFGVPALWRSLRNVSAPERAGWIFLLAAGLIGAVLLFTGARRDKWLLLTSHEALSVFAIVVLAWAWSGRKGWLARNEATSLLRFSLILVTIAGLATGAWWLRTVPWQRAYRIQNPTMAPANMADEGSGATSPYFPSSAETSTGKTVPEDYFMDSSACKRCHADIYNQWESSAHHYSSFNNQWYRKSIEYMQEVNGVQSSKWCAGCHDAAMFFPGNFNTPVADRIFTPPAQAGMGCMVCHSIRKVKSTMGNGDFVLEYPALHRLVTSKNPLVRSAIDFLVETNPEPHRRTFQKPFMSADTANFCSACHKVHLDVPVNNYRWIRGFNDYDNWQASGVSGMGARSFYYPPKPMDCADCHMPQVASKDAGNLNGLVHSHRFIAANTALPFVNKDWTQLAATEQFLKAGKVRVDIFAISPETSQEKAETAATATGASRQIQTTFAVGEEAEAQIPAAQVATAASAPISAPLNRVDASVRAGDTERVDVVVRTVGVGHFFPGGTIDAFDCWLELKATDDAGRVIFWSGMVEDDGHGPVEKGAHFYKSLQIDAHGNPINKRNAWATRATVYVHLIPPGAADTAHFRLHIPKDARGHIHLQAKLNYRKFSWFNTQFSFAGVSHSKHPNDVTREYDDREISFTGNLKNVSGEVKAIPDLPIVTMAVSNVDLAILPSNAPRPQLRPSLLPEDWQRWNDYGIGLLLQGDLRGAEAAFQKVTEIDSQNPDGWVNIGRVRLQEGNIPGAREVLEKALKIAPSLARTNYFYARVLRQVGDYDGSISHLRTAVEQYPKDRVVRDDLGRVLFLKHNYAAARDEFNKALEVDPEDLEANYNLMLCYTGMGDAARSAEFQARYMRFKADEMSQTLTGPYREKHPEDNLERQPVHEHASISLPLRSTVAVRTKQGAATNQFALHSGARHAGMPSAAIAYRSEN